MQVSVSSIGIQHIVDNTVGIDHVTADFVDHQHIGNHIVNNGT